MGAIDAMKKLVKTTACIFCLSLTALLFSFGMVQINISNPNKPAIILADSVKAAVRHAAAALP